MCGYGQKFGHPFSRVDVSKPLTGAVLYNVLNVCLQCYTIHGLELSRITVVNTSLQVVYDTYVRPDNDVIDYNTR